MKRLSPKHRRRQAIEPKPASYFQLWSYVATTHHFLMTQSQTDDLIERCGRVPVPLWKPLGPMHRRRQATADRPTTYWTFWRHLYALTGVAFTRSQCDDLIELAARIPRPPFNLRKK